MKWTHLKGNRDWAVEGGKGLELNIQYAHMQTECSNAWSLAVCIHWTIVVRCNQMHTCRIH